jgi:cobalamin biosynthesis protein CbiG
VSEASALAAAGAQVLLVPRTKDGRVTVAVARWEEKL